MNFLFLDDLLIIFLLFTFWLVIAVWAVKEFLHLSHKKDSKIESVANFRIKSLISPIFLRLALVFIIGILLTLTAIRPVYGVRQTSQVTSNLDVAILVDISLSMNVRDLESDKGRLEVSQNFLKEFIQESANHRYSVISFSHQANVDLPLTGDKQSALTAIDTLVEMDSVYAQGSDLKQPLETAVERLINPDDPDDKQRAKAVILVSDGEMIGPKAQDPGDAIKKLKENGIQVYTLGAATEEGGYVRGFKNLPEDQDNYYIYEGEKVVSKLDRKTLEKISSQTEGKYYDLSQKGLDNLSQDLSKGQLNMSDDEIAAVGNETYYIWQLAFVILIAILVSGVYYSIKPKYDFNK
jgi:Ca-activated chloride channel homolog